MRKPEDFLEGFVEIAAKEEHIKEIDNLINNDYPLDSLEEKLKKISALADLDRKLYTKQSIISWIFIVISIISIYLSINISTTWYYLSIPVLIITLLYLKVIRDCFFKLIFKYDAGMIDYIEGRKIDSIKEPKYSYIYMEKRLKIKIAEIKDS